MKVKDAMHKGVDWVSPDTPVSELAKLMRDHDDCSRVARWWNFAGDSAERSRDGRPITGRRRR